MSLSQVLFNYYLLVLISSICAIVSLLSFFVFHLESEAFFLLVISLAASITWVTYDQACNQATEDEETCNGQRAGTGTFTE